VIRFVNDVLLSAPSIIIGLFVYELLVIPHGHFSAIAARGPRIIAMPVTVRTTEDMLNLVPQGMKDASTAMGLSLAHDHQRDLSGARSGILTACCWRWRVSAARPRRCVHRAQQPVLGAASRRSHGQPAGVIFQFALSPYPNGNELAWSGALLITLSILILSISARVVVSSAQLRRRAVMSATEARFGARPVAVSEAPRSSSRCGISISTYGTPRRSRT